MNDASCLAGYDSLIATIYQNGGPIKITDSQKRIVDELIKELTDRQRMILQMRFGLIDGERKTLQQIGDIFGVCRERVRQLEKKALRKLKHPTRKNKLLPHLAAAVSDRDKMSIDKYEGGENGKN